MNKQILREEIESIINDESSGVTQYSKVLVDDLMELIENQEKELVNKLLFQIEHGNYDDLTIESIKII